MSIVFYLLTVLKEWNIVLIPDVQVQVATHVVCQLKGLVTGCGQVPTNLKVLPYSASTAESGQQPLGVLSEQVLLAHF